MGDNIFEYYARFILNQLLFLNLNIWIISFFYASENIEKLQKASDK